MSDQYPILIWRVRYQAADGRMTTVFLPVKSNLTAEVMETPALKVHCPDWIGQNFVTMTGKLFLEQRMKLTCKLVGEGETHTLDHVIPDSLNV